MKRPSKLMSYWLITFSSSLRKSVRWYWQDSESQFVDTDKTQKVSLLILTRLRKSVRCYWRPFCDIKRKMSKLSINYIYLTVTRSRPLSWWTIRLSLGPDLCHGGLSVTNVVIWKIFLYHLINSQALTI